MAKSHERRNFGALMSPVRANRRATCQHMTLSMRLHSPSQPSDVLPMCSGIQQETIIAKKVAVLALL
jgi:hypothetical protein